MDFHYSNVYKPSPLSYPFPSDHPSRPQNTAASYEHCRSLLARLSEVGHPLSRRGASFALALMLRRGEPHEVLKLLQQRNDTDRAMLRDLKVRCDVFGLWDGGGVLVVSRMY